MAPAAIPPEIIRRIFDNIDVSDPRSIQALHQSTLSSRMLVEATRDNSFFFQILHVESWKELGEIHSMVKANRGSPVTRYARQLFVNGLDFPRSAAATRTGSSVIFSAHRAYVVDLAHVRLSLANRHTFLRATTLSLSHVTFAGNKDVIDVLQCFPALESLSMVEVDYGHLAMISHPLPRLLRRLHLHCARRDEFLAYLVRIAGISGLELTHLSLLNIHDGLQDSVISILSSLPPAITAIALSIAFGATAADASLSSYISIVELPIASYNNAEGVRDLVFHADRTAA